MSKEAPTAKELLVEFYESTRDPYSWALDQNMAEFLGLLDAFEAEARVVWMVDTDDGENIDTLGPFWSEEEAREQGKQMSCCVDVTVQRCTPDGRREVVK